MPFFLLLLLFPLIEIAVFIIVGGWIGVWATLALIVLGVLAGLLILRGQHDRMAQVMAGGLRRADPAVLLARGALTLLGGVLLIAPGFVSDALGLLLLLPPVQRLLTARLRGRVQTRSVIIEGDYTVDDPETPDRRLPPDRNP